MKKVIFTGTHKVYDRFELMLDDNKYLGFIPVNKQTKRFGIITSGPNKGLATNFETSWTDKGKDQPYQNGLYYSFKDQVDLVRWLSYDNVNPQYNLVFFQKQIYRLDRLGEKSNFDSNQGNIYIEDFEDLINNHIRIGFVCPKSHQKFHVLTMGSYRGIAVNLTGTYTTKEKQKTLTDYYYIFDTNKELLDWLGWLE